MTDPANESSASERILAQIRERFEIDVDPHKLIQELDLITRQYSADIHIFGDSSSEQTLIEAYRRLQSQTEQFKAFLSGPEYADLETDIYWAALHKNVHDPEFEISVIGQAQSKPGAAYLKELNQLLELLVTAAELGITRFSPVKGRKRNYPLENLVRRLAFIWTETFERKFTVDYHQGSGLTEAFEFVELVATELGLSVTDTEIVTSMRTVIKERR